ncbi:MAG: hypothetical protein R3D44_12895 [Hyphomicrobiaceae bacterium]
MSVLRTLSDSPFARRRGGEVVASIPASADARRVLLALAPAVALLVCSLPFGPIAQPLSYHHFHDTRGFLGVPNFLDVLSNLPFGIIGVLGMRWLLAEASSMPAHLRRAYLAMFAGVALTSAGSAYYHWAPSNGSIVWDRLPIAMAFMGLFAGFLTERLRLGATASGWLLAGLLAYGAGSVLYWTAVDDLRPYVVVQIYPILALPILLWLTPAPYTRGADWMVALGAYVVAKVLEEGDGMVFAASGYVSGHTLKHLAAAAGAWWVFRMLRRRIPLEGLARGS